MAVEKFQMLDRKQSLEIDRSSLRANLNSLREDTIAHYFIQGQKVTIFKGNDEHLMMHGWWRMIIRSLSPTWKMQAVTMLRTERLAYNVNLGSYGFARPHFGESNWNIKTRISITKNQFRVILFGVCCGGWRGLGLGVWGGSTIEAVYTIESVIRV